MARDFSNKQRNEGRQKGYTHKDARENRRPTPVDEEADGQVIFGRNAVRELLNSGRDIDKVFVTDGAREGSVTVLVAEVLARRIPLVELDRHKLDDMCGGGRHQGIVALCAARNYATVDDMLRLAQERGEKPFIVIADGIEDPHNLGAIIRSAECAGAHGVIIPKRRAVGLTSVVAKASAGAIEYMPIARVVNLSTVIKELKEKGLWVYGADMVGTPYHQVDMTTGLALVLGSEGAGISRLVSENCDGAVSIPMFGHVNSMNVSAAAAVLFCEAAHQRHSEK